AFSGYAMLFYQNTVWLDVMYFFPLLLISFDGLIKNKKIGGLIFCLSGMLVLNYYLSYMVVIFTVLFFGVYLVMNRGGGAKGVAPRFIIGCVIAAALSAVIWLPSFAQYLSSARGNNIINGLIKSEILTNFNTCLPLLFCSAICVALFIVFLRRRETRQSRFYVIMCFLMLLPVVLEPINKMWHTGDYMAFPVRYGYMVTMMMLCYGAVKLEKLSTADYGAVTKKRFAIPMFFVVALLGAFSVWYYYTFNEKLDSYSTSLWGDDESFILLLIITCFFAMAYTLIMSLGVLKQIRFPVLCVMLSLVTVFECFFSSNVYIASASYNPAKYNYQIVLEDKIKDDERFWRLKLEQDEYKYFDANLIGGLGYNSFAHYTSLTSEDYMFAMKRLGYSSYWMEVTGNGGTLLTDAMMSVGYTVERLTAREPAVYRDRYLSVFKTEYYMPLGIVSDSDLSAVPELPLADRIYLQQFVAEQLFGANKELFTEYECTGTRNVEFYKEDDRYHLKPILDTKNSALTYRIYVEGKQTLYFDCFDLVGANVREYIYDSFGVYV
ncbi:MAG: YfhO family protein, partial [Ruminiclostridium sp.]|nr:YfhO family protein [Ruminiclostridium sp.]